MAILLSDTFTDTDGTDLTAHTMDVGGGWTAVSGAITITSNKAVSGTAGRIYLADAGIADVTFICTINFTTLGTRSLGLIARATDGSNHWKIYLNGGDNGFRISEINLGVETVRAVDTSVTLATGTDYVITVVLNGDTITASCPGLVTISYNSASFNSTATKFGLFRGAAPGTNATWNDFLVQSLSAPTSLGFYSASNSGYQSGTTSLSWSHNSGGNFLAVDVEILSVLGTTVTEATYNGVAMTLIGSKQSISGSGRVECWGLTAPALGTNTIAITLSASVAAAGTAASYYYVHQTSPTEGFASAQATNVGAADATVSITSVADQCWIHAACASDDTAITAGQTSRNNVTGALGSGANEDFGPQSPGAKSMTYTNVGALATWVIAGYAIRPQSAASLSSGHNLLLLGCGA